MLNKLLSFLCRALPHLCFCALILARWIWPMDNLEILIKVYQIILIVPLQDMTNISQTAWLNVRFVSFVYVHQISIHSQHQQYQYFTARCLFRMFHLLVKMKNRAAYHQERYWAYCYHQVNYFVMFNVWWSHGQYDWGAEARRDI